MPQLVAILLALLGACRFEPGALPAVDAASIDVLDATPQRGTLFVADYTGGNVYRFRVTPADAAPMSDLSIGIAGSLSPMIMANGELWVSELSNPRIDRYATPLVTPTFIEAITGHGLPAQVAKMALVDSEVWLVTAPNTSVTRLGFAGGAITDEGAFTIENGRGIVFDAVRRNVWVSQCCNTSTVARYAVGLDGAPSYIDSITTGGLNNPHGMVITPWGELLVANHANANILRYSLDAFGVATFTGAISGSELTQPLDLALTSWNELFVTNLDNGTVARFQFDASRTAIPKPTIRIDGAQSLGYLILAE